MAAWSQVATAPSGPGESAQLVILWVITDCALLIPGQEPQIELTAILGTKRVSGSPTSLGPSLH